MGVFMRHFMIWPMLVPAIAFCHDEISYELTVNPPEIQIELCCDCHDYVITDSWHTRDFDSFLQDPLPEHSINVEGTITDEGCDDDIFYDPYDMNAR